MGEFRPEQIQFFPLPELKFGYKRITNSGEWLMKYFPEDSFAIIQFKGALSEHFSGKIIDLDFAKKLMVSLEIED